MALYTLIRLDTATRVKREALSALCPGWVWDETKPQYAILGPDGAPADWPLIDTYAEAVKDCREFNDLLRDDDGAASEARWCARMSGDMDA